MALSSLNPVLYFTICFQNQSISRRKTRNKLTVYSSHSNPKILKSNRRSRFGQRLSPYDSDNEKEAVHGYDDDDDWFKDDPGSGYDADEFQRKLQAASNENGNRGCMYSRMGRKRQTVNGNGKVMLDRKNYTGKVKQDTGKPLKNKYRHLSEEIELDERWFPLLDYLTTFGLKDSHFIQMYGRHIPSLQINFTAAKERLDYLMSVGVKNKDKKNPHETTANSTIHNRKQSQIPRGIFTRFRHTRFKNRPDNNRYSINLFL